MALALGDTLGPYEILAFIGAGGMGEVWKARDTRLNRTVAIKRLSSQYTARFEKEARSIAALNHPNICQLYDIGPDYLVMEFIEGTQLSGRFRAEEAVRLAIQIAGALEEAHSHGILHRDLKPGNIMITTKGSIKLLDFGLAKLVTQDDSEVTRTSTGTITGTAAYMSPEQAQGKPVDARSDIFSFGAVLYEMVSGVRAFAGGSLLETLTAVVHRDPAPLQSPVAEVVRRCLAKQPHMRFPTARELRLALERIATRPVESQPPSIAVLPFVNMSGDREQEYFSDGLAEEIINALARIPGLKVTARTSAFSFKGKDAKIAQIASELGVEHILEGSVRKAGNRIRITAQLIDAADGFPLWSERYDRELIDIFEVQEEIAGAIAGQLKVSLSGNTSRDHVPPFAAYEAFLEGRHHGNRLDPASLAKAFACAQRALEIDPNYAEAHEFLGAWHGMMAWAGLADPREMYAKGHAHLKQALQLDASVAEAHALLGAFAGLGDYDWVQAAEHLERALQLNRSLNVRLTYALWHLRPLGRLEEALAELEKVRQEDPLSAFARREIAHLLVLLRRFDEAADAAQQALELEPGHTMAMFGLVEARLQQGRTGEAIEIAERAARLSPGWLVALAYLALAYSFENRLGDAGRTLEEMHALSGQGHANATALASGHLASGDFDGCFEWLHRAIDQREPIITTLKHWPVFDSLRADPRFPALLRRMNLG